MAMVTAMAPERRRCLPPGGRVAIVLAACCLATAAHAGKWDITPTLSVNETLTDNVGLSATDRQGDLVTDIAPGIRIVGHGDRARLNLDYQLHNHLYARDSSRNRTQNLLNAVGSVEAIEDWLFIDLSGAIAQQSISAFGGTAPDASRRTGNSTETRTFRISPYIEGSFGSLADYRLRHERLISSASSSRVSDLDRKQWEGELKGVTGLSTLTWQLDAMTRTISNGSSRSVDADQARAMLKYRFDPQFRVSILCGREWNNYFGPERIGKAMHGGGIEWSPTERTQVALSRTRRFFGDAQTINLSHRSRQTVWRYSDTKDVTVTANPARIGGYGEMFDLYYSLYAPQLAAQYPNDPDGLNNAIVALLQANGITPDQQAGSGFLSARVLLQHRRQLSLALIGVRNTLTLAAVQSDSEPLGSALGGQPDDFSLASGIRQRGLSANWSHRLSGLSTLNALVSRQISTATGGSNLETTQNLMLINFTTQLAGKTRATLGARHTTVEGATTYRENALTGSLSHQF